MKNQNRNLWVILLVMIIINMVWLGYFWLSKSSHPQRPTGKSSIEFIASELNLTPEQKEQVIVIREAHFKKMSHLLRRQKKNKKDFFNCSFDENDQKAQELLNLIEEVNREIDWATYQHFKDLQKVLGDKQSEKLKVMLRTILHPPKPHHPPHGHHPPHKRRPIHN